MHAALAALAFWQGGGGVLLDLSLSHVTAYCLNYHPGIARGLVVEKKGGWQLELNGQSFDVKPPQIRRPISRAARLGRDTTQILTEFGIPC